MAITRILYDINASNTAIFIKTYFSFYDDVKWSLSAKSTLSRLFY